jgi:hypothetical protein
MPDTATTASVMTPNIDAFLEELGTLNQTSNGYRVAAHLLCMVQGAAPRNKESN